MRKISSFMRFLFPVLLVVSAFLLMAPPLEATEPTSPSSPMFQPLPFAGGAFAVVVDDMDMDGHSDLIVTNRDAETVQVLYQKASRQFEAGPITKVLGFHANELTRLPGNEHRYVLNAEGDEQLKVLAPDGKEGLREIANRPQGGSFATTAFSWPNWGTSLAVMPYQGPSWTLLKNFQADTAGVDAEYTLGVPQHSIPGAVTAADIDGDGIVELLYTTRNSRTLWRVDYPKNGQLPKPVVVWTAPVGAPRHVVVADLNGDDALDILLPLESERRIAVLLNEGNGHFTPGPELLVPGQAWGPAFLAIAKVKDGSWLLATDTEQSLVFYRIETGNPYQYKTIEIPLDGSVKQLKLQDVDGDGEIDLIVVLGKLKNSLQILYGPLWREATNLGNTKSVAEVMPNQTVGREDDRSNPASAAERNIALTVDPAYVLAHVGDHAITIKDLREFGLQGGFGQELQTQVGQIKILRLLIEEELLRKAIEREKSALKLVSQEGHIVDLQLLEDRYFPVPPPPDEAVLRAYYDANREQFGIPELVRLVQIQFRNDRDQSRGPTARQRAEQAMRRLETGEDFSKVAAELTENPRARDTGAERGFVARNAEPWLRDAVRGLQPGQRTGIVQSPVGYELLLMTDWRAPLIATFETVRAKVVAQWQLEQQRQARDRYLKTLAQEFGVVVNEKTLEQANPSQVQSSEPLEHRVQRYWTARSVNDLQTVYSLEAAARPGGWLTPDQYRQIGGLPVREVQILETKVEGERASVKLQGKIEVGSFGWTQQTLTEEWVLIDGEWYHQTPKPRTQNKS